MYVTEESDPVYSRLNELLEGVPGFVWEYKGCPGAPGAHLAYVSPGVRDIFGDAEITAASALSRIAQSVHPEDAPIIRREFIDVFNDARTGDVRIRCLRDDGEFVWLDVRMSAVLDESGAAVGLHGMAMDVSEHCRIKDALQRRESDFRNLAESSPDLIARFDRNARHTYVNRALVKAAPVDREAIIGKTHTELGHPRGNADRWEGWVRQVLCDGVERVETFEQIDERGRRFYHARIIPERNENGEVESVFTVVRDLSDQRRVQEMHSFLATAGERLSATLDYDETLATVTDLAVPLLADICAVDVLDDDGQIRRVAERNIDPGASVRAKALVGKAQIDPNADFGVPLTIRTGESQIVPFVNAEWLASVSAHHRTVQLCKVLGVQSLLSTALSARGKVIGSMTFATTTSGRHFSHDDLVLAEVLSSRCAQAIENAILFRQVEQMNRSKDEFIAMLGHELRNPLASISNAIMAVKSLHSDANDPFRHAQTEIMRQIGLMARLVDDLLDASRITRGQINLRLEPMDAGEAVYLAVSSLETQAAEKGHQVVLELPTSALPVSADPVRMQQILTNLLRNAIRYTPHGGHISVVVRQIGNSVSIRFKDDGQGMDAELVPRVFDLLVQGRCDLDRTDAGLGIGLTLVKRLAEMHGGTVEARSDGPGKGSEFVVSLPMVVAHPSGKRESIDPQAEAPRRPLSILVADDNAFAARMLAQILRSAGHEVATAGNGEAAIDMALRSTPDVVLLDIGLPGIDGYEVARRLRLEPSCAGTRLIALTGYGGQDDRQRSTEAGFEAHLVKPLDYDMLESHLARTPEGREN